MLIDEAYIILEGGRGGDGNVSFFPGLKSGPSGGTGGRGGDVYVRVNRNMASLKKYSQKTKHKSEDGGKGDSFNKSGANGADLILEFPVGTELHEKKTGKIIVLPEDGRKILVCQGGRGGYGNDHFKSATNRAPRQYEKGFAGEERIFKAIMKLIADIGLIGLPNAGKSSLLHALTHASPKIAPYPFTTLEPNLGALESLVIADIPGLIEGASQGKGLGIRFLKHIEKVKLLIHCIASDCDMTKMKADYAAVRNELGAYNTQLLEKKEVILLTKSDLILPKERKNKVNTFKKIAPVVLSVSVYDPDALEKLTQILRTTLSL